MHTVIALFFMLFGAAVGAMLTLGVWDKFLDEDDGR